MIAIMEITRRCNLKCRHCFIDHRLPDLELPLLLDRLSTFRDIFDDFRFVGGEPLMVPDRLEAAIQRVTEWGKVASFTTNGLLLKSLLQRVKSWRVWGVYLSIDGVGEVHDLQRGAHGVYEKVREAAMILSDSGIRVQILCCITRLNYMDIDRIYALANEVHADAFRLWPMIPIRKATHDILLSPHELKETFVRGSKLNGRVEVLVPHFFSPDPSLIQVCQSGYSWIYVRNDGIVLPCMYAPIPIGRIGDDEAEILIDRAKFKSPAEACLKCEIVTICKGGCRGGAFGYFGDANAPDPNCWKASERGYAKTYFSRNICSVQHDH